MEKLLTFGYPYVDIVLLVVIFVLMIVVAIWGFRDPNEKLVTTFVATRTDEVSCEIRAASLISGISKERFCKLVDFLVIRSYKRTNLKSFWQNTINLGKKLSK